jgi:hypothetical protein
MDIATRRLHSQRLAGDPLDGAAEVVGWLGAVQSQDYPAAAWALGQRARDVTAAGVHQLFDAGAILRTHLLRPTWHLVLPADIRWLLALTGPRIRAGIAGRLRRLEIDGAVITRAETAFTSVLAGGRQLTRVELAEVLRASGIAPDGQRLSHLILAAELDALVVSGPRRGREFTYMLLEERVPARPCVDREEGLSRLAERYFRSRGPAQLQDFAWWAGVTLADTRAGVAGAGSSLASEVIGGTRYWFDAGARPRPARATLAHLLPTFDELTVAYRDRSAFDHPDRRFDPALFAFGSVLSNVLVIAGRVRGAWRRVVGPESVRLQVRLLDPLTPSERAAVARAAQRMGRFHERRVELEWETRGADAKWASAVRVGGVPICDRDLSRSPVLGTDHRPENWHPSPAPERGGGCGNQYPTAARPREGD